MPLGRKALKSFIFLLLINLFFFLGLEFIFYILNLFPPIRYFSEIEDERGIKWVEFKEGQIKPRFPKEKSEDSFRIFALGESTTAGSTYFYRLSFPKMLGYSLERNFPEKKIELINLGVSAINSRDVMNILKAGLNYEPDLVIIYCGQNEFFRTNYHPEFNSPYLSPVLDFLKCRSRIFRALSELVDAGVIGFKAIRNQFWEKTPPEYELLPIEDHPMSEDLYKNCVKGYRQNLDRMLFMLEQKKIPVILCTLAVNLKDWPPSWIPYPEGVDEKKLVRELHLASTKISAGDLKTAEEILFRFQNLAKNYAMFHFIRGHLKQKQGDYASARDDFIQARNLDTIHSRHRASPEINEVIKELGKKYNAFLVDIDSLFLQNSSPAPGFDLFTDHIHPNINGHYLIAQKIFETIGTNKLIDKNSGEFPPVSEFIEKFEINENILAKACFLNALFYLIQRRLPDNDAQTASTLNYVISVEPRNFLARFFLISLLLENNKEEDALLQLEQTFKLDSSKEEIKKMLLSYFFPNIVMQDELLLFHLNLDPLSPPLRGIISLEKPDLSSEKKALLPKNDYQFIFRYHPEKYKFEKMSPAEMKNMK